MKSIYVRKNLVISISLCLIAGFSLFPVLGFAQEQTAEDTKMQILQDKVKADKKLVVAENMTLTDEEAKIFWPLYEEYQKELQVLNEKYKKTIEAYAVAFNAKTLDDETAMKLLNETFVIEMDEVNMRKAMATKLAKVLPGKKAVRYLQIENKIRALIHLGLADGIPLME